MKLTSERLSIDWAEPGSYYNRTRFDWTGFITQVTLDGATTFCVPEAIDGTGTGGCGLCNEFGIMEPIGFDDCPTGEWFPKIGVGILKRPDNEQYSFVRAYECKQAPMRWTKIGESAVEIVCDPIPARGYAWRLTKRIEVECNRLMVSYTLENVGEKPLKTREYIHNFLMVNEGEARDFELRAPFDVTAWKWPEHIEAKGNTARWIRPPANAMYVPMEPLSAGMRRFTLTHIPTGASVTEEDDTDWSKLTVWGTNRVISGEAFINIDVAPGSTQRWTRTYTFERPAK